jgi:LmbE family N-acetylglucosaminyl deacetylase
MSSSRRNFVKNAGAGLGLLSLPHIFNATNAGADKKLKVVCVGGHPDDPESGCGGTLARFTKAGHAVTIIYLTRGEAGIPGKSHDEAAAIRTKEATEACKILQTKPIFAGQIDGGTIVNMEWIKNAGACRRRGTTLYFTHWPIDSHPDHQAASLLPSKHGCAPPSHSIFISLKCARKPNHDL